MTNPEYSHLQFLAPVFTPISNTLVLCAVRTAEFVHLSKPKYPMEELTHVVKSGSTSKLRIAHRTHIK